MTPPVTTAAATTALPVLPLKNTVLFPFLFMPLGVGRENSVAAVQAAVTQRWSNGPVEGHVNRLKTIKRQMYGRAGFVLLRARVLNAA